ncbi:MAG: tripartite tricarboxylate transporter substrate binding protein [Alcaligenaceae bacterium]
MNYQKLLVSTLISLFLGAMPVKADPAFPNRSITVLIGFAPGGPTDAIGRVLFRQMAQELAVPMVIENKPGAGGNTASQELLRAKPDGYTLLYGSSSITTAPPLAGRDDLSPKTAFVVAGCSVMVPLILLVNKKINVGTSQELLKLIKDHPDQYFLGSSGNGAMDHLIAMDVASRLDLKFQHVPYKGNGPALTDVAAGNITFMYSGAFNSALPFIKSGQVKALAVTSERRSTSLPDVPSLSESVKGLEGFNASTWQVILAPKGTDPATLAKLDVALKKAMTDPKVLESFQHQGAELLNLDRKQCQQFVDEESDRWSATIKKINLKSE